MTSFGSATTRLCGRWQRTYVAAFLRDFGERPDEVRQEPFRAYELQYQGKKWSRARRVVLIIVPPEDGEFVLRSFFRVWVLSYSDPYRKWDPDSGHEFTLGVTTYAQTRKGVPENTQELAAGVTKLQRIVLDW